MIKRTITTKSVKSSKTSKFGVSNCTSLVLYGSNLSSTVGKGRFSEPGAGETMPPPRGKFKKFSLFTSGRRGRPWALGVKVAPAGLLIITQ